MTASVGEPVVPDAPERTGPTLSQAQGDPAKPPVLTVIVPVRNDRANLERCLASLRASLLNDFEVIVIDDASTDDTPDAAEAWGARLIRLGHNVGPARARNRGARDAAADVLVFIDADVCVNPHTLAQVSEVFRENPDVDALFGSYDADPAHRGLLSQYRNLVHHYTHQCSRPEAATFWSGCGAIRREVFLEHGGFDADLYSRPCIEDIELGVRLAQAGRRIRLDRGIQATHLKKWTLWKMVKTDVLDRGVPWTVLMHRYGSMPNDLNLRWSQRASALLALLLVAIQAAAVVYAPVTAVYPVLGVLGILAADHWRAKRVSKPPVRRAMEVVILAGALGPAVFAPWWALALAIPLAGIVLLNLDFYRFFMKERTFTFAIFVLPLHVLYYLYSVLAFGLGTLTHLRHRLSSPSKGVASKAPR